MFLALLIYLYRLTVTELGAFIADFLAIFKLPTDEPSVDDPSLLVDDICLSNKEAFLEEALSNYEKCLRRERKLQQTEPLNVINRQRTKLFSAHRRYIQLQELSSDEVVSAAAKSYRSLLDQFIGFQRKSNASRGEIIRKYIANIQNEDHAEAFATLQLQDMTTELETVNESYIELSKVRDEAKGSIPDSPTETRSECVKAYRDLVALINFAKKKNKYYNYDEKIESLNALTSRYQELINRRRNASKEETEVSEGTDMETIPEIEA